MNKSKLFTLTMLSTISIWAHTGHINWSGWDFDWEVKDGAGLAIRNVQFQNHSYIYKASLPVIRVHYETVGNPPTTCGPYADRIDWPNLQPIPWCNNGKLCQQSFTANGHNWLKVAILGAIGSYRLYQVWFFSDDGWIHAQLYSKGLQCQIDHQHHPYWRFDLDVDGPANDQVFVFDNGGPDSGWGAGWSKHKTELNEARNPPGDRKWFVRDGSTARGVWVIPSVDETAPSDSFSNKDAASRLYRGSEDAGWQFGPSGHLGFNDGENIEEKDVVFWYVAHLRHDHQDGGDQWHVVGPWLKMKP